MISQQVQSVPLFMNRAPTAEEVENNPDLAALAAIVHDDGDPEGTRHLMAACGHNVYG